MSSELSSAVTEDAPWSLEWGSRGMWGQGVETAFLHQPHPEGRGGYLTASWSTDATGKRDCFHMSNF